MKNSPATECVILVVLDGWGIATARYDNAITSAKTPNFRRLWASYPHTQLGASGESVGLPRGEVGNTETGHLNLGAGRIVYQDLARINMSIADGSIFDNQTLINAIDHANKFNSNLHLMGLIGAGGVHSNIEHLFALIEMAKKKNFTRLFLHLFTDGRDSPPTAAKIYIDQVQKVIDKEQVGQIATIMGRYWAMDRDRRWDRTQKAYVALTQGEGHKVKTAQEAIDMSYQAGKTDEFIEPSVISKADGTPVATIKNDDSVIFYNFRIDRPRQLTKAFAIQDFSKASEDDGFDPYTVKYSKKHTTVKADSQAAPFKREVALDNLYFVTMTEYSKLITQAGAHVAFPPEEVKMSLGKIVAEQGWRQLRVSESEKERFVTYYFSGLQEMPFVGEERLIISSPKVATYDLKPEMSAVEMTDALLNKIWNVNPYKFILINFANADMVGHTGNLPAAIKACETIDICLGKIMSFVSAKNITMLVTADHGNAEEMINSSTGQPDTEHSNSPVPFIAVNQHLQGNPTMLRTGILADVAPTVLRLLGVSTPSSMLGRNLLEELKI